MSGFLALLDDVVTMTKLAATSVDDVLGQAAKAGTKAAGAVIDDAAVTPKYLHGFDASRELPVVWRIARGSIRNKLLILLPAGLLLTAFAPWVINPLLMLGGAYLCFEGAEKIAHALFPPESAAKPVRRPPADPRRLEESRVKGAIKTDFILSAEIMTIALASITSDDLLTRASVLVIVAVAITIAVYGSVALIVKADDVGLHLAEQGRLGATRQFGRWLVKAMPGFLVGLSVVGTAAMLWVGGSIVLHGLDGMGVAAPAHLVHDWAAAVGALAQGLEGLVGWIVEAALYGLLGLALGMLLVPIVAQVTALTAQES